MTKVDFAPRIEEHEDLEPSIDAVGGAIVRVVDLESHEADKTMQAIDMRGQKADEVIKTEGGELRLTLPESRTYGVGEEYQFLVHVPLGSVSKRFDEVGSDRDGVLMASIINGDRQGTFEGQGGLLIRPAKPDAIKGISESDAAGEMPSGHIEPIEELLKGAPNSEYNQVDLEFDGSQVVGVVIKMSADGIELGDEARNRELRALAEANGIPVALVEIAPSAIPTTLELKERELPNGNRISTYDIPIDGEVFVRLDVAKGRFYHTDSVLASRAMVIDAYGQSDRNLGMEQKTAVIGAVDILRAAGKITDAEALVLAGVIGVEAN